MRTIRDRPVRATFLLPEGAALADAIDTCLPLDFGCELELHGAGLVLVGAHSREALFLGLAPFLVVLCAPIRPQSIAITVSTTRAQDGGPARDSWTVIVGANIAFCPSRLPPLIPQSIARAPPLPAGESVT